MEVEKQLYTINELAVILNMNPNSIRNIMYKKRLNVPAIDSNSRKKDRRVEKWVVMECVKKASILPFIEAYKPKDNEVRSLSLKYD